MRHPIEVPIGRRARHEPPTARRIRERELGEEIVLLVVGCVLVRFLTDDRESARAHRIERMGDRIAVSVIDGKRIAFLLSARANPGDDDPDEHDDQDHGHELHPFHERMPATIARSASRSFPVGICPSRTEAA